MKMELPAVWISLLAFSCILVQLASCQSTGCNLGNVAEPCDSTATRYYHDPLDCQCKVLPAGTCQDNSHASVFECLQSCGSTKCPVCNLPKRHGTCTDYTKKWYYSVRTCQCEEFPYGGCDGNDNRFETFDECNGVCGGFACPICNMPSERGTCKGYIEKWYFDDETCTCKNFTYGGCDGNSNRFYDEDDCEKSCFGSVCRRAACKQERHTGPCKTMSTRFFYNQNTERCERFLWGGCQPNSNNFVSKRYCRKMCMNSDPLPDKGLNQFG